MARGSRITPFLLSSNTTDGAEEPQRPKSADNAARTSTSAIFPGLRKLETTGSDANLPTSSRQSTGVVLGPLLGSPPPHKSVASVLGVNSPPIVTLKLTGPSFLDVVARDSVTKQPVYIMETVRNSTFVYRLDSATNEAVKAATVQWPPTAAKGRSSGRSVQMHNGRWRDTEQFLKFGALTNFLNRKFELPHFPHPLKWKPAPGSSFQCTTQGVKGPIAVLEAAYMEAPPRLRVYNTLLDGDRQRAQQTYHGVPVMLLDYLMATSLLLVTEVQEWLDRKQSASGTVRIPGSSMPAVKKWLAIIHDEPPSPSPTAESPATATSTSTWESRSTSRMSAGASSVAGSSSSDPTTPSTPATSAQSLFSRRHSDIPPVPPVPEAARTRPPTLTVPHPYASAGCSSSEPSPSAIDPGLSSASSSLRPLPKPPIRPYASVASLRRPSSAQGAPGPSASPAYSPLNPSPAARERERSSSPSGSSSSAHTAPRRSATLTRRSLTIANLPPPHAPPLTSLPLPPKLSHELHRQRHPDASVSAPGATVLQMTNPDALPPEEEERLRQSMRTLALAHAGPAIPHVQHGTLSAPSSAAAAGAYMSMVMVPAAAPHGMMVDAGMIRVPGVSAPAQRSYVADPVFEQPPPAYDAIDFSLRAQVRLAPGPTQPPPVPMQF